MRRDNRDFVSGRNAVLETLQRMPAKIEKVLVARNAGGEAIRSIRNEAKACGVPVQMVPEGKLNGLLPGVNHQGSIAITTAISYRHADELLNEISPGIDTTRREKPMVVILDRIEDPQNLGAIIRSVAAAGAQGLIVPERQMAPVNARAIKTSGGAALRVPIARTNDLPSVIQGMKERGYWVAGADNAGQTSVWEMDWDRPIALVIGSEHSGMTSAVKDACDYLVRIPLKGDVESLNASVSAGILLFIARGR